MSDIIPSVEKPRLRIIRGQFVSPSKLELARHFRKAPTPDERALWTVPRSDALKGIQFRRQQVIGGFRVDFYCAAARLAIELDGPVHATQSLEDAKRDLALASMGIRTMRIMSERVRTELKAVLEEIAAACEQT
jgi:very-short-patch-repair endonuclease